VFEAAVETARPVDRRFSARFRVVSTGEGEKSRVTEVGETAPGRVRETVFHSVFHGIINHGLPLTSYFGLMIISMKQLKQ